MRKLHLDKLKEGLPGISPAYGAFLAEAATVCLVIMGHRSGVQLSVTGDFEEKFRVEWAQEIGAEEQSSWADLRESVEYASMGVAILLMEQLAHFRKFVRKDQAEVGDIALIKEVEPKPETSEQSETARMEVSGILKSSPGNSVSMRISTKRKQTTREVSQNPVTYLVVVEFSSPKAKIIIK